MQSLFGSSGYQINQSSTYKPNISFRDVRTIVSEMKQKILDICDDEVENIIAKCNQFKFNYISFKIIIWVPYMRCHIFYKLCGLCQQWRVFKSSPWSPPAERNFLNVSSACQTLHHVRFTTCSSIIHLSMVICFFLFNYQTSILSHWISTQSTLTYG